MRDSSINPRRETPPADVADLNVQLTRAYLAGDGAAVERIMALIDASETREPIEV